MLLRLSVVGLAAGIAAALSAQDIPADTPVSSLLASAQSHLSKGETSDALVYYDAAIARDPSDYLTFFKRATTYLGLGRVSHAAEDIDKVLSLQPSFEAAHVILGKIKQRSADWEGAREQFSMAKHASEQQELLAALQEAEGASRLAKTAEQSGNWEECVNQAGAAIMVASRAPSLRELRARCRFARGEVEEGLSDLQHLLHLRSGDTAPYVTLSAVNFYSLGELEKGLAEIRKCLHSDQESKACKALLKQEKAVQKTMAKVTKAFSKNQPSTGTKYLVASGEEEGLIKEVKDQDQALRASGVIPPAAPKALISTLVGLACQGYYETNSKKAKDWCEESLELDGSSFYGLLYKHKGQIEAEMFEAAIETLKKASEAHPDKSNIVNPLLNEAQVLLKRSKTKDYYKVLGVAHDADEKQIKSAYRKLSKQHHPDKAAKQGLTKEQAEKKMASINEAYEVLSDPELRARFDRGDDPMSNEQQNPFQQGGQFPFGGGGQPFVFQEGAQGGQRFKFQFGSGGFPGGFPFGG